MADTYVDYYAVLEVSPTATQEQIRTAYKKAALKTHPDRVPTNSPERAARTKKFQKVNDAYYTLSEATRRRDYDDTRAFHTGAGHYSSTNDDTADEEIPRANTGGFPWSTFGFGGGDKESKPSTQEEKFSKEQFGNVFEEMMRDSGLAEDEEEGGQRTTRPNTRFWQIIGAASGGAMGFIVANFAGAVTGALAGGKLGSIRDTKGKSVYAVYQELPQGDKAKLLSTLATKVFASALSG